MASPLITMEKQKIAETEIRNWIQNGEYPPGAQLPGILEMAKKFNMTGQPIRIALKNLEKEGLISITNGVGSFVKDPKRVGNKQVVLLAKSALDQVQEEEQIDWFISRHIYAGIKETAQEQDIKVLTNQWENFTDPETLISYMKENDIFGVIFLNNPSYDYYSKLVAKSEAYQFVSANYSQVLPGLSRVQVNIEPGFIKALNTIYDMGHRNIAYFYPHNVHENNGGHMNRFRLYVEFIQSKNMNLDPRLMVSCKGGTPLEGYRATNKLLKQTKDVSLIFTSTDDLASGVIDALEDLSLKVPEDISVLGFNNAPIAAELNLSSVATDRMEIGRKSVELLMQCMEDKCSDQVVSVNTTLCKRSSIGAVPPIS